MASALRIVLPLLASALCPAAEPAAVRWEGAIQIPGRPLRLIVDLDRNDHGEWTGSATFPDLGIKGAALTDISVNVTRVSFAVKGVLSDPQLSGSLTPDGAFEGDFRQGGNIAPFSLRGAGPPQVDPPRQSVAVRKELEGAWEGDMTFAGRPVHVKLALAGATAKVVFIGRRETALTADFVAQESENLTLELHDAGMTFNGRYDADRREIAGTLAQGPIEAALVLHR
jgi:hypothetical protein